MDPLLAPLSRPSILPLLREEMEPPPPAPAEKTEPDLPRAPYEQAEPKAPADPTLPPGNDGDGAPQVPNLGADRAALKEARFNAAMAGVDRALARLSPAVRRTVGALAQLAWGRAALGDADPARLSYEIALRRRELSLEQQQLAATAHVIDRWRGESAQSPGGGAASGLSQRDQRLVALQRSITCGRRYAALVEWAAGHGGTTPAARAKILSGC